MWCSINKCSVSMSSHAGRQSRKQEFHGYGKWIDNCLYRKGCLLKCFSDCLNDWLTGSMVEWLNGPQKDCMTKGWTELASSSLSYISLSLSSVASSLRKLLSELLRSPMNATLLWANSNLSILSSFFEPNKSTRPTSYWIATGNKWTSDACSLTCKAL